MSTHPYIPLYVDDYDAHTAHLTPAEDGVYLRLLRLCWRTPGCSLPNDDAWIARKIRLSTEDYEAIARPVLAEFFNLSRGRLIQRRLKDEYDDISRKKSARAKAGKSGGEAKALKTKENASSNARLLPSDTRAFPNPEPEPEDITPQPPSGGVSLDEFLAIWSAYPEAGRATCPMATARQEIDGAAAAGHTTEVMLAGAKRMAAHVQAGGRAKRFDRWARDRLFENAVPRRAAIAEAWDGPPELWDAVSKAKGPGWVASYLGSCMWRDNALVTASPTVQRALEAEVGSILRDHGAKVQMQGASA